MYKKHNHLLTAILLASSFDASALGINGNIVNTKPEANDDYISTVVKTFTSASGNVGINDRYGTFFTLDESWVGKYGAITSFSSEGEYTYELFDDTDSDSLPSGGVGTEHFTYTYFNERGTSDTATLNIQVHKSRIASPEAKDDYNSVVVGVFPTADGSVGDNDLYGNNFSLNDSRTGEYGSLTIFTASGLYIYQLFDSTNSNTLPSDGTATEHFKYTYSNELGDSDTASLYIDITANPVKPIAKDDFNSAIVSVSPEVSGNVGENDLHGSTFSLKSSKTGEYGSLTTFTGTGAYTYTLYESTSSSTLPDNQSGIDSFEYLYTNENGLNDTASLIIDISANPSKPIARDDFDSTVVKLSPITSGNVGVNDRFGNIFTLKGSKSGQYGLLKTFSPTGDYIYELYDSTANNNLPLAIQATERFQYTYEDETGSSDTAWLNIDINANQPLAPIANDDYISTVVGVYPAASGSVAGNDYYGQRFSLDVSWLGEYGAITSFDDQGKYSYELFESTDANKLPDTGIGIDSFTYTYANEEGLTGTARIIVDVRANPTQPIANDDYSSAIINTLPEITGEASTNDRFGDSYTLEGSWAGQYGVITEFTAEGSYSYTLFQSTTSASLPTNGVGIDKFQYTYSNEKGFSDTAFITIDVRTDDPAQAEAPIANNDHVSVVINTFPSATGDVLTNDRFGSSINFNGSSAGKYGFLNAPGTSGVFTYTLFESTTNADLPTTGIDTETYSYTLTSANGATDTANLTIDVNADPAFSGGAESPIARDDNVTITPNLLDGDGNVIPATINNNVITNDSNGDYVVLSSSPSSLYGTITLEANGDYTYKVYETATSITNLKAGEVVTDTFSYTYFANSGESANAQIIIQIIGNPIDANGDTIFENPDDQPYDNVDVEFNNSPQQATPLNSSRNILGHLYDTLDTDWYFLPSEGDEIITLEVCPKGTSCFGKKSWVLYVFALDQDADGNITGIVNRNIGLRRWLDETAGTVDLSGATILTPEFDTISHMYAAYRKGNFEGQLIGIVDPCFDTLNSVDIGVKADTNTNAGDGDPKNYVFAISSVLRGNGESEDCGDGTIILTRPGTPVSGHDADNDDGSPGAIKSYAVTEEYITVFPFSDDQYAIKITGTGLEPLLSERAAASSATFDSSTGTLSIPRVRVNEESYTATLDLQTPQARSENSPLKFVLSELGTSDLDSVLKTYRATYNAETQQVLIPRVTDTASGLAYSVVLSFQDNDNGAWFEVVSIKEIK